MPAKFRVEITPSAEADIREIYNYIAEDSPNQAAMFVEALEHKVYTLEQFPMRCPLIPESNILGKDYRHLIHGHYRMIFRVSRKTVYVVRVIHHTRLLTL